MSENIQPQDIYDAHQRLEALYETDTPMPDEIQIYGGEMRFVWDTKEADDD